MTPNITVGGLYRLGRGVVEAIHENDMGWFVRWVVPPGWAQGERYAIPGDPVVIDVASWKLLRDPLDVTPDLEREIKVCRNLIALGVRRASLTADLIAQASHGH